MAAMGIKESVTSGVQLQYLMVVNWWKIYRNTYGNRGIGNLGAAITVSDGGKLLENL